MTKRKILSTVARIFDPVGFAAPFIIRAKIGIQQLWQQRHTTTVSSREVEFFFPRNKGPE